MNTNFPRFRLQIHMFYQNLQLVKFCQSALTCNHRIVLFDEQPKWLVHCQTAWISFFVHYLNLTVCFDNISKYDCAAFCFPCCHWEVLSNQTSYCCSGFLRFILNFCLILLIPVVDFYRQTDSRQRWMKQYLMH